ncbi:MAG TPA: PqqD family peptide modification chaperone [Thermoplasmata archaeon]|nr:PqqD family peptide modification chaperone [Thermoplasmata archaeon]
MSPFLKKRRKDEQSELEKKGKVRLQCTQDAIARNFLDQIPVITAEWIEKEGVIGIVNQRFKTSLGKKIGAFFGLAPYFYVRIKDKYGIFIWKHIDGKRTVREIGIKMFAKFSEDETLNYHRIKIFMDTLEMNKYISYKKPEEGENEDG